MKNYININLNENIIINVIINLIAIVNMNTSLSKKLIMGIRTNMYVMYNLLCYFL